MTDFTIVNNRVTNQEFAPFNISLAAGKSFKDWMLDALNGVDTSPLAVRFKDAMEYTVPANKKVNSIVIFTPTADDV